MECGKTFISNRKDKKFCNTHCRVYYHRRNKEEEKQCKYCGKYYTRKMRDNDLKHFCSIECKENKRRDNSNSAARKFYARKKSY